MAAPATVLRNGWWRGTSYDKHASPASFSVPMGALPKPPVALTWPVPGFSHQFESSGIHHHSHFAEPAVLTLWSSQATFLAWQMREAFGSPFLIALSFSTPTDSWLWVFAMQMLLLRFRLPFHLNLHGCLLCLRIQHSNFSATSNSEVN